MLTEEELRKIYDDTPSVIDHGFRFAMKIELATAKRCAEICRSATVDAEPADRDWCAIAIEAEYSEKPIDPPSQEPV